MAQKTLKERIKPIKDEKNTRDAKKKVTSAKANPLLNRIKAVDSNKKSTTNERKKINPLLAALQKAEPANAKTKVQTTTIKSNSLKITKARGKTTIKSSKTQPLKSTKHRTSLQIKSTPKIIKIHNLAIDTPYDDLFEFLTKYGVVLALKTRDLPSGSKTGEVLYMNEASRSKVVSELNGRTVDDRVLRVEITDKGEMIDAAQSQTPQATNTASLRSFNQYQQPGHQFNGVHASAQQLLQEQLLIQAQFAGVQAAQPSRTVIPPSTKGRNKGANDLFSRIGRV